VQQETTKNSSPPVPGERQRVWGSPANNQSRRFPCRALPTKFHMFHPVTSLSNVFHVISEPLSASNVAPMPCLQSISVLRSSLPRHVSRASAAMSLISCLCSVQLPMLHHFLHSTSIASPTPWPSRLSVLTYSTNSSITPGQAESSLQKLRFSSPSVFSANTRV
jgi:hypothetical protein